MTDKVDFFGLADNTAVVVIDDDQGASATTLESKGQDGSIVAIDVIGAKLSPSNTYKMKGQWAVAAGSEKKLGKVTETSGDSVALLELAINTSNDSIPEISAKGEQVEDDAEDSCLYTIPAFTLEKKSHAQVLWGAFTLEGSGCHLQTANYTCSCKLVPSEKNGMVIAFDVAEGKIECEIEILQVNSTAPTLSAGSGWVITDPLSRSNQDSANPTYKAKLTKYLAKDAATSSSAST